MKVLLWVNRIALTLLSFSTAAVKLAGMDEEMVLFRGVGFSDTMTVAFGVLQLIGAGLLVVPRWTRVGGVWMAVTFVFATGVVFANGMIPFGLASLLFPASAAFHALRWPPAGNAAND